MDVPQITRVIGWRCMCLAPGIPHYTHALEGMPPHPPTRLGSGLHSIAISSLKLLNRDRLTNPVLQKIVFLINVCKVKTDGITWHITVVDN